MNEVATKEPYDLVQVLESSLYPGAKRESILMVMAYCEHAGLDPLQKPVHIVPMSVKRKDPQTGKDIYEQRDVIMPGINLYRVQAAETKAYAGQTEPEFGPMRQLMVRGESGNEEPLAGFEFPEFCKVTVTRIVNGVPCDFTAMEYWTENYATKSRDSVVPNDMWRKRARGQLAKCTEAQALRKAFPEKTGAPTAEEMAGKVIDDDPNVIEGTAREKTTREPQRKSQQPPAQGQHAEAGSSNPGHDPSQPESRPPHAATPRAGGSADPLYGEKQWLMNKLNEQGRDLAMVLADHGLGSLDQLTAESFGRIRKALTVPAA